MSEILSKLSTGVIEGNKEDTARWTQDALRDGLDAQVVLNDGLMPDIDFVGVEFRAGNMYVPEVLRSARAMQASMDVLKPLLVEGGVEMLGKVLVGDDVSELKPFSLSRFAEGQTFGSTNSHSPWV